MLTTLENLRAAFGLSRDDVSQDENLIEVGVRASNRIRRYCRRYFGAIVDGVDASDPAVITVYGHQLESGETVVLSGTDSDPVVDGEYEITVLDRDRFSIVEAVDTVGTTGFLNRVVFEYHNGNGTEYLQLQERPVQSLRNVWVNDDGVWSTFTDDEHLLETDQYSLVRTSSLLSTSGEIFRVGSVWGQRGLPLAGRLQQASDRGAGNVKVEFLAGYKRIPDEVQAAVDMAAMTMLRSTSRGGPFQSESMEDYSYTRLSAADEEKAFTSVKSMLAAYRTLVV